MRSGAAVECIRDDPVAGPLVWVIDSHRRRARAIQGIPRHLNTAVRHGRKSTRRQAGCRLDSRV